MPVVGRTPEGCLRNARHHTDNTGHPGPVSGLGACDAFPHVRVAEAEGFEPPDPCGSPVLKSGEHLGHRGCLAGVPGGSECPCPHLDWQGGAPCLVAVPAAVDADDQQQRLKPSQVTPLHEACQRTRTGLGSAGSLDEQLVDRVKVRRVRSSKAARVSSSVAGDSSWAGSITSPIMRHSRLGNHSTCPQFICRLGGCYTMQFPAWKAT
jgi:hypothetical protein